MNASNVSIQETDGRFGSRKLNSKFQAKMSYVARLSKEEENQREGWGGLRRKNLWYIRLWWLLRQQCYHEAFDLSHRQRIQFKSYLREILTGERDLTAEIS